MPDVHDKPTRSENMSVIRGTGNKNTEWAKVLLICFGDTSEIVDSHSNSLLIIFDFNSWNDCCIYDRGLLDALIS